MKRKILTIGFVLSLGFIFSSCEKCWEECDKECDLIPAKIIRFDCDRVIFQLQSDKIIGDADWVDVTTGLHYSNVVSYNNTCIISELSKGEKITLYVKPFKINESISEQCYSKCQAVSATPPQTKVNFISIEKESCSQSNKHR